MTQVIAWQSDTATVDLVRLAVKTLREGGLVALPTETTYALAANATSPDAMKRLQRHQGGADIKLALADPSLIGEWLPDLGRAGQRLSRRLWPGPLTLLSGEGLSKGKAATIPEPLGSEIRQEGRLGFCVPDHEVVQQVLRSSAWPVAFSCDYSAAISYLASAEEILQVVRNDLALVIDDGPTFFKRPSTLVEVKGSAWSVVRPGALSDQSVVEQAACRIVFVCTGNTCRSPLAEALCKKRLADRLGCSPDELPAHGFVVLSAGLAAMIGEEAAKEAVQAAQLYGANLERHTSRQATVDLLLQADHVLAMTQGHLDLMAGLSALPGCKPRLLSARGEDIADPIGGDAQVYELCARQIYDCLGPIMEELLA
ncbi:MAG: Sua5/YciO/YrdC/YwlC family protein [Gemmataceae bacterium]